MSATSMPPPRLVLTLSCTDRPGIVGHVGTLLGKHAVNIAGMSLSRDEAGGEALTVLNLDSVPGDALIKELTAEGDIKNTQVVQL